MRMRIRLVLISVLMVVFFVSCASSGPGPQIQLSPGEELTIELGTIEEIEVIPPPELDGQYAMEVSSSDPTVAIATPDGMILAEGTGTTLITYSYGPGVAELTVNVIGMTVAIENIWINEAMYDQDGKLAYGPLNLADQAFIWTFEPAGDLQILRNVGTGRVIAYDEATAEMLVVEEGSMAETETWLVQPGSIPQGNIFTLPQYEAHYLHVEQKTGFVQFDAGVQAGWTSPQWRFIRPQGDGDDGATVEDEIEAIEMVRNGGFDKDPEAFVQGRDTLTDVPFWFFGFNQGGAGGNAIASLDSGEFKVNILEPGNESYAIQLIQAPIKAVKGTRYRVSFDARASQDRQIEVKIGGQGGRGWADYTDAGGGLGTPVAIGTEMERHSFEYLMEEETDDNARLEFQLGAVSFSQVWIDNVEIEILETGVEIIPEDPAAWVDNPNEIAIPDLSAVGAQLPFVTLQAESAETDGEILGPNRNLYHPATEASGRMAVRLSDGGQFVRFTAPEQGNSILLRYSIPDTDDGSVYESEVGLFIDGVEQDRLSVTNKYMYHYGGYPWSNDPGLGMPRRFYHETRSLTDQYSAGSTIEIRKLDGDDLDFVVVDLVDLEQVPEPIPQPEGFISLAEFGGRPNDGRDDSFAFEQAMLAAERDGKGLYIPPGTYYTSGEDVYLSSVDVQGAGMWYSELRFDANAFPGIGATFALRDLTLTGNTTFRDNMVAESGFRGPAGKNSVIERVWFRQFKVGIWSEKETDGLLVQDCRFRDFIADGINFARGTKNSTVRNSHFRNTGDDGIATWSATYSGNAEPSANNTIENNTIELPWLANGIAVYGGRDHTIRGNLILDIISDGAAINISSNFEPVPFAGTITVENNVMVRAGSVATGTQRPRGAIWIWAAGQDIAADLMFKGNKIYDASYSGVVFEGRSSLVGKVSFDGLEIDGARTFAIEATRNIEGTVTMDNASWENIVEDEAVENITYLDIQLD